MTLWPKGGGRREGWGEQAWFYSALLVEGVRRRVCPRPRPTLSLHLLCLREVFPYHFFMVPGKPSSPPHS